MVSTNSEESETTPGTPAADAQIYFQWQNPHLLKTIYPARERKLAEFLLVYDEIEIVKKYKNKKITEIISEYDQLPDTLPDVLKQKHKKDPETENKMAMGQDYIDQFNRLMESRVDTSQDINRNDAFLVTKAVQLQQMTVRFQEYKKLDHKALMERVVERFHKSPEVFPEWIIYMVIHFSGMRYQSAHGCYRDPLDLLRVLGISTKGVTDEKALEKLKDFKREQDQAHKPIPDWAWHDIVKFTPLRNETQEDDWEAKRSKDLTTDEGQHWDQVLKSWEPENTLLFNNLTLWRFKHEQSLALIVTSGVCNEVGEHIQHLRGLSTSPGLALKPDWYNKQKTEGAFFKHQDSEDDFQPGAAILWLEWYDSTPGAHEVATRLTGIDLVDRLCAGKLKTGAPKFLEEWTCWFNNNRFQRTISIKQTQADKNLIKPLNKEVQDSEKQIKNLNKKLKKPKKLTDSEIKAIQRDIKNLSTKIEQANQKIEQFNLKFGNRIQFMRWRHEAIVVSVENMINGRKVITFETEPGNMGINLRPNQNLQGRDQDVFVGYSPAKELTQQKDERLVEMIRWDKILQAPGYPERMRYQDAISKIIPDGEGITMQEKQLMVINLKGANLPTKKVLNRGSKLFAVQLEKEGVISFRVTRCETEPEAVGAILNSEDVTLLQTCFWVEVKEDTDCKKINSWNKNKFPMFRRSLPKLTLKPDKPFLVSANHQFNPQTDKGGLIRGDGKSFWYLILHHPDHPEAAGLYVSAVPSIPISSPESWETIQSQIQSGMLPGKPSPDETDDTAVEELFMVTKPTGIQLENSLVLPRGSRLFGKISKKGGGKSIQITRNDDFPGSVGQRIESAEATPVKTCLWVKTNKATTGKIIAGFNQNGFPLFKGTSPKVIIPAGTVLLISATHQVSPTDKGGQIQGDGKQFYYLVLEHRGQPEAACLFVFASDLDLLSAPLLWEEAQNQSKDGHTPGVFTEDKDLETGEEELILVIKEAGIELADGQVIPRGAILSAGLIEKGGNEFYLVKKYAALPQATGTMIDSADTSTITQCLWVSPSQDTIPQKIDGWNKKGFPIFIESEGTKLLLPKNKPFLVSATHEFNEEDAGGVIKGNGGKNCYLIIEHESQPAAAGLYVLAKAVTLKTKPQPWEAIQAEKDAVANPPTETPFGPQ